MHYLVTGARGFVMSVLVKEILTIEPDAVVTAVDLHAPDDMLTSFLAGHEGRVQYVQADVTDSGTVTDTLARATPDVIVHGATVTHDAQAEHRDPKRFIHANVGGTTTVLDAARRTDCVQRFLLVSSGAVYGSSPERLLTEESPPVPDEMYGISKVAGELITQRFGRLYGFDVPVARLTKMFGPMERPSSGRAIMSLPYHLAAAVVRRQPIPLTERTLQAGGDWLSATQAARALHLLARGEGEGNGTYNISSGIRTSVPDLLSLFGVDPVEVPAEAADADMDSDTEHGKNGIYASDRAQRELAWTPTDLKDQVAEYVEWAREHPDCFAAGR
ncbi:dTDP-glucose 4,6-dehydratase/UDP-glucose 4-epimerase/GDP-4-dehydro-6-deoxy-D-mannose reductase [Spinactinospora alkalitolerans]|uniref:dTDP-glucose 4,6-dehydratase/UDP-glucose 4-epimerase/GDP-4-dehydro-6-deoxy-D-mannose reductase n=1 Tax=Spinactinospora alkalitolerans TaxID=687207 RepID=A0A852U7S3_9ACTN|nr:NAD(P)-dependent oxidoreductase [Spinactinospora alkalitolerans]NYE50114.1 dTDP-glucose 4,6-dehydratase/UDP-glucose 4-epimerase/GDP-4-dehydro-6-deoxy-D-mannose reductase [Spinactinospora alkalitolerans]